MIDKRDFCVEIMGALDDWCEEMGFEVSGYDVAEFAEMAYMAVELGEKKESINGH